MFCPNCGTSLPATIAFCPSCGGRTGGAPAVAAPPAVRAVLPQGVVQVSVQGVDRSLRVNGSYDAVPFGPLTADQLASLLGRLMQGPSMPPGAGDADLCAVNVVVEGPAGTVSLCPGDGRIGTAAGAGPFSPADAALFAFGGTPSVVPVPPPPGGGPVRHAHVPPTDLDRIDASRIRTGPGVPQTAVSVRRTGFWGSRSAALFLVLAIMAGALAAAGAAEPNTALAGGAGLAAVASVGLLIASLCGRDETLRIGIDPAWNVLWFLRAGEPVRWVPHANALRGLRKDSRGVTRTTGRVGGVPVKGRVTVWSVVVVRSDGTDFPTFHMDVASESEADRVVAAGTALLQAS